MLQLFLRYLPRFFGILGRMAVRLYVPPNFDKPLKVFNGIKKTASICFASFVKEIGYLLKNALKTDNSVYICRKIRNG